MKRELIIACAAAAILSSCATPWGQSELPSSSPRVAEIHKALNQTVIPEVDIENATIEDALKTWSGASRGGPWLHYDFRYSITYPMTYTMKSTKGRSSGVSQSPRLSVRRKNITSRRLLDEICHQANFVWIIMGRVIVVKPASSTSGG